MTDHHRMMIRFSLAHMQVLEEQLTEIDNEIAKKSNRPVTRSNGNCCGLCPR